MILFRWSIFQKKEPVAEVRAMAVVKQATDMATDITYVPFLPSMDCEMCNSKSVREVFSVRA